MLGNSPPKEYYDYIYELENQWEESVKLNYADAKAMEEISNKAFEQEQQFFEKMDKVISKTPKPTFWHMGFWNKREV